jgi:DNA repair ATPase RecN
MKSLALAFALTLAPISALADAPSSPPPPSPSPVPTIQQMPSGEQIFKSWQRVAPQQRKSDRRYRAALLAAVEPNRQKIGAAIGRYLTSERQDQNALAESIDRILTQDERERVAAASVQYFNEQCEMSETAQSDMRAQSANRQPKAESAPTIAPTAAESASVVNQARTNAARILASQLLAPNAPLIEQMTYAQWRVTSPLNWHGPDDAENRQRLRTAMLTALSAGQRTMVAEDMGEYAVSVHRDPSALAAQLDAMLSTAQQKQILDAYGTFAAAQKASLESMQASFAKMLSQIPQDQRPPGMMAKTVSESPEDSDPGSVLARTLLSSSMTITMQRLGRRP